jgi:hypothetical protein
MIAVLHLDIDSGIGHSSRYFAELSGHLLIQAEREDIADGRYSDACGFEGGSSGAAVLDQEMRYANAVDDEHTSAFQADSGPAESLAHVRKGAGTVFEFDG